MVSIIICFYERLTNLKCCLDSLRFCSEDFDEVIITDDGSSQETVAKLQKLLVDYPFPIEYVWQENRGFRVAAARNNGIRKAKGDYLIFFDCDFLILPSTVRMHRNLAKPRRFVAGNCKYLNKEQTDLVLNSTITPDLLRSLYASTPDTELYKDHMRYIRRTILMHLGLVSPRKQCLGGHFSIHRTDIEQVNGYDENFVGWGGEDEDLGIRLVKAGIFCRSGLPQLKVLHAWHPPQIANRNWQHGPNIAYFNRSDVPAICVNGLRKLDAE